MHGSAQAFPLGHSKNVNLLVIVSVLPVLSPSAPVLSPSGVFDCMMVSKIVDDSDTCFFSSLIDLIALRCSGVGGKL